MSAWKRNLEVGFLYSLAVIGFVLVNSAGGTVFFVNPQATGVTNGLSWSNAYRCLPESLRDARAGDEIWVAAGTYFGNIAVPAGVSVYGGFSGNETERTQRDWMSRRTVIEPFEPDWLLVLGQAESLVTLAAGSRLDGFIVENGRAPYAAGVYVGAPDAVAANNTIVSNRVTGILGGAGVFVDTPSRFPVSGADEFFHRYADAFLRVQYPFSATNIPVYPTNQYSPQCTVYCK